MTRERKNTLETDTVIRLDIRGNGGSVKAGSYWLMNHRYKGWASFGYNYPTLSALLDAWDIDLGAHDADPVSAFIHAHPRKGG